MNQKLKSESQTHKGDLWLGIVLLGTSILTFTLSGSIQAIGLGDNLDPGPKAFPIGLAALLALGGLIELWLSRIETNQDLKMQIPSNRVETVSNPRTVLLLLACFLVYVLLVPWLGFALSTVVMAPAMMILLGNSWKQSLLVSIILIIVIYALFVVLFKVPLPGGVLGMPL